MPEFFGTRFDSPMLKIISSIIVFIFLIPYTASLYNGLSRLFGMAFNMDYSVCIIVMAILTGIYTGAGERNWVFYVRSLHIFQRKINEILAPFDQLPLEFYAEEDPAWDEYREMRETEIPDGE